MSELLPKQNPELDELNINKASAAADLTVSDRFSELIPEKRKKVTKLVFQRAALSTTALFTLLSSGCGNINTPIMSEFSQNPSISVPSSEGKISREYSYIYASGLVKIAIDKNGLPVNYVLPDGETADFNKEISKIRQKAIESGEPEIITLLSLKDYKDEQNAIVDQYSKEHPKTMELPDDTMSTEELAEKGVDIIQSSKTNLYIRKGAFEKGGLLENLNNDKQGLTIVLIDGPIVSRSFMEDPKYSEVMKYLPTSLSVEDVFKYRSWKIKFWEDQLENARQTKGRGRAYESKLLEAKAQIETYKKLSDKQILERVWNVGATGRYYLSQELKPDNTVVNYRSVVYLAVGENETSSKSAVLYFDSKGEFKICNSINTNPYDQGPEPSFTHPDPANLKTVEDPKRLQDENDYMYEGGGAGFTLRHELGHYKLIKGNIDKGLEPNRSERNTDLVALDGIVSAWQKWKDSGYTDNSGYSFVFSLPPEKGGGYILTRNLKSTKPIDSQGNRL